MVESAASVSAAAQALTDLASAHATQAETIGGIVSGGETHVATCRDAWGGPRADVILGAGEEYLAAIKPTIGALESIGGTLTAWSKSGFEYAGRLQTQEANRAGLGDNVPIEPAAADHFFERHRAISTAIESITAEWSSSCTTFANRLADDTTTLLDCNLALLPAYDARAADDNAYVASASEMAVVAGIEIATVDSSGWLESRIGERAAYLGSEDGALMFLVFETANQQDIGKSDGNLSQDDIEAATDPAVVRALLLQAAEKNNFEWDPEALDLMVAETVATAWTMRASTDEEWEDIDDDVEWYERGVFRFARDYLIAPAYGALVGGLCYAGAAAAAAPTAGVSLGASGFCGGLGMAAYTSAQRALHGGDVEDVLTGWTDPRAWAIGATTGIVLQGATNFRLRPNFWVNPPTPTITQSLVQGENGLFGTNVTQLTPRTGGGYYETAGYRTVQVYQTEAHGGASSAARLFMRETGVVPTSGVQWAEGSNGLRYIIRPSNHGAVTVEVFDPVAATVEKIRFVGGHG